MTKNPSEVLHFGILQPESGSSGPIRHEANLHLNGRKVLASSRSEIRSPELLPHSMSSMSSNLPFFRRGRRSRTFSFPDRDRLVPEFGEQPHWERTWECVEGLGVSIKRLKIPVRFDLARDGEQMHSVATLYDPICGCFLLNFPELIGGCLPGEIP